MTETDTRAMPNDLDAEQATLGAALTTNAAALVALSIVGPEDFYREAHRSIASAMKSLADAGKPVELITVSGELRRAGLLEEVGGGEYLTALMMEVGSTGHIAVYAETVREKSLLRQLAKYGSEVQRNAGANPENVHALLAETVTGALQIADQSKRLTAASVADHLARDTERLQTATKQPYGTTPARFGISRLDEISGGLGGMYLVLVMAERKAGKTAFGLQAALSSAYEFQRQPAEDRQHVLIFPLEEGRMSWLRLATAWLAEINSILLLPGRCPDSMREDILSQAAEGMDGLAALPIVIADNVRTTDELVSAIMVESHRHRLGLIVVDYLQRLSGEQERESLTRTGRELQRVSEATQAPILVLSQMSVSYETGQPLPYGSRGPTFDASMVLALKRDEGGEEGEEKRKLNSGKIRCLWARSIPEFSEVPYRIDYQKGGRHYAIDTLHDNPHGERLYDGGPPQDH